jgi:hypothetical protein
MKELMRKSTAELPEITVWKSSIAAANARQCQALQLQGRNET